MLKCVQIEHKIANAEEKDNTKKIKTLGKKNQTKANVLMDADNLLKD